MSSRIMCLVPFIFLSVAVTEVRAECNSRELNIPESKVMGAYLAYYGRPADSAGWTTGRSKLRWRTATWVVSCKPLVAPKNISSSSGE